MVGSGADICRLFMLMTINANRDVVAGKERPYTITAMPMTLTTVASLARRNTETANSNMVTIMTM